MNVGYRVHHHTGYRYSEPVQIARHLLHLVPRGCPWQIVEQHVLAVAPEPAARANGIDPFGNPVTRIELSTPHDALLIDSTITLRVAPRPWHAITGGGPAWNTVRDALAYHTGPIESTLREALTQRFESPNVRVKRELELFALPWFTEGRPILDATADLMSRIHAEFTYDPEATAVGTSILEVLERKRGVCQDFAHLMIGCLRALGLAARYVSGYLRTDPPEGEPRLQGADASHAWVAIYLQDIGWVEFDPTNDCRADQRHLVLGWGRDFSDVSPVRGVIQGGGEHTLEVSVTVTPLDEAPLIQGQDSGDLASPTAATPYG